MHIAKQALIGAVFGFVAMGSTAQSADNPKIFGLWKITAFHTEDVATKAQNHLYGDATDRLHETGDGRTTVGLAGVWLARSIRSIGLGRRGQFFDPQRSAYRAVFYSGQYRLGQDTLDVNIDQAEHEGWVGAEPFDLTWTEGRTSKQETRSFRVETDAQEREILRIETAPMRNPNGAENTIIGRAIWTRVTDWEFGQPN